MHFLPFLDAYDLLCGVEVGSRCIISLHLHLCSPRLVPVSRVGKDHCARMWSGFYLMMNYFEMGTVPMALLSLSELSQVPVRVLNRAVILCIETYTL